MLTQPVPLASRYRSDPEVADLVLSTFASSILTGLGVVIACTRIGQPSFIPPTGLRYAMSARARRLMRSGD